MIEPGKEYLVESRLLPIARKQNFESLDALVDNLRANPRSELHKQVVDAMTTNETSFFRDLHPFDALKKHILPELLISNATSRQLNFWCGAASTGQECCSVLMTIAESAPQLLLWKLHFLVFHQECQRIARLATTKTFVHSFGRRYDKRRGLLIMKWTVCHEIGTALFNIDVVA